MTTRSSKLVLLALLLLFATVLHAGDARAQPAPSPSDVETARTLYVEGLELRDGGNLKESLARFRAAFALVATPITALELGRAHSLLHELLEAREVLSAVERIPVKSDESQKATNARLEARLLADGLKSRIPAIRVVFDPKPAGVPHVTIDGAALPPEAIGAPRKVNPGKHVVLADLDGARASADVDVTEAETRTVTLKLPDGRTEAPNPPPKPPIPGGPPPPPPDSGSTDVWFYGGLTAAGVGVLVGAVTGILAFTSASTVQNECNGTHCPPSVSGDLSTSKTFGNVSNVAFVVAGVGGIVALVAWVARPSVRPTARALEWSW